MGGQIVCVVAGRCGLMAMTFDDDGGGVGVSWHVGVMMRKKGGCHTRNLNIEPQ